jgi:DNA-binding response OmpR family regulator
LTQNRRILIVDDDKSVGEFVSSVCRGEGFGVTVTHSAEIGLKELEQEGYGLVITGIFMEGMGGMAMIQTIVATMPHIFILAISAGFGDMTSSKTLDAAKKNRRPCRTCQAGQRQRYPGLAGQIFRRLSPA